jgi:hypothetical protein
MILLALTTPILQTILGGFVFVELRVMLVVFALAAAIGFIFDDCFAHAALCG